MITVIYFLAKLISIALSVLLLAMMIRALLPIFTDPEESRLYLFVTLITEPFIIPFRLLLVKLNIGQNTPLDMSFLLAYLVYSMANLLLPAI